MNQLKVHLNLADGEVMITHGDDHTLLVWQSDKMADNEGFEVKEDTIGVYNFGPPDGFLPVSEVAAELFLQMYIDVVIDKRKLSRDDVEYIVDGGIKISAMAFLPFSIDNDNYVQDFPDAQDDLRTIWMKYLDEGRITVEQICAAKENEVLYDFLSLINLEQLLDFSEE